MFLYLQQNMNFSKKVHVLLIYHLNLCYSTCKAMTKTNEFNRKTEFIRIERILLSKRSEFIYVRGRRRIGKSWILKSIANKHKNQCLYFMGAPDQSSVKTQKEFAQNWSSFSKDPYLENIKPGLLNWSSIFSHITNYVNTHQKKITLIFDEVQWIAKEGSGFVGHLKSSWLDWEKTGLIKVLICGSSNKFFHEKTGGEEKILRGIKTQADVFVGPISLQQCKERFKKWNHTEVALMFMLTGGVPYYLNQIDAGKAFIPAINDAFFTSTSIYLSEVDEIISLEFNKQGSKTVKKILEAIGGFGCNEANIVKKTKLSKSTVHMVLEKLVSYKLVTAINSIDKDTLENFAGTKYLINDFYLNCYFSLIEPIKSKISKNDDKILFHFPNENYYLPNFTGPLFEKLITATLNERNLNLSIFKKLQIRSLDFEIKYYWNKESQIDLIIESKEDRISRAIEIKWQSLSATNIHNLLENLSTKDYPCPTYYTRQNFLIGLETTLSKNKIPENVITITDFLVEA